MSLQDVRAVIRNNPFKICEIGESAVPISVDLSSARFANDQFKGNNCLLSPQFFPVDEINHGLTDNSSLFKSMRSNCGQRWTGKSSGRNIVIPNNGKLFRY